jgi:hypothetical protein
MSLAFVQLFSRPHFALELVCDLASAAVKPLFNRNIKNFKLASEFLMALFELLRAYCVQFQQVQGSIAQVFQLYITWIDELSFPMYMVALRSFSEWLSTFGTFVVHFASESFRVLSNSIVRSQSSSDNVLSFAMKIIQSTFSACATLLPLSAGDFNVLLSVFESLRTSDAKYVDQIVLAISRFIAQLPEPSKISAIEMLTLHCDELRKLCIASGNSEFAQFAELRVLFAVLSQLRTSAQNIERAVAACMSFMLRCAALELEIEAWSYLLQNAFLFIGACAACCGYVPASIVGSLCGALAQPNPLICVFAARLFHELFAHSAAEFQARLVDALHLLLEGAVSQSDQCAWGDVVAALMNALMQNANERLKMHTFARLWPERSSLSELDVLCGVLPWEVFPSQIVTELKHRIITPMFERYWNQTESLQGKVLALRALCAFLHRPAFVERHALLRQQLHEVLLDALKSQSISGDVRAIEAALLALPALQGNSSGEALRELFRVFERAGGVRHKLLACEFVCEPLTLTAPLEQARGRLIDSLLRDANPQVRLRVTYGLRFLLAHRQHNSERLSGNEELREFFALIANPPLDNAAARQQRWEQVDEREEREDTRSDSSQARNLLSQNSASAVASLEAVLQHLRHARAQDFNVLVPRFKRIEVLLRQIQESIPPAYLNEV